MSQPVAILVLGARVGRTGVPGPALTRRIGAAVRAAATYPHARVIACGGRAWDGVVEADVMARELEKLGVHRSRIVRDRLSMTTIENLREGRKLAGSGPFSIVTCDWHAPRALAIARAMRLEARAFVAETPPPGRVRRTLRDVRERVLRAIVPLIVTLVALVGCKKKPELPSSTDAASPLASLSAMPAVPSADLTALRVAADRRDSAAIPAALAASPDPLTRRAVARALAQIGDAIAIDRLGRSLSDDDPEVVAWSAYGLGMPCEVDAELPREDRARLVRGVVARALSLEGKPLSAGLVDPWSAIAWSLGRCGGIDASRELARWLKIDASGASAKKEPTRAKAASWALGAIAARDHGLEDDVAKALLDAARSGLDDALFPFGRGDWSSRPPTPGLAAVARGRLGAPGRMFAIRALGRAEGAKAEDLRALLVDPSTAEADRVEALRALHKMGADAEVAAFATRNAPVDEKTTAAIEGPLFGAVRVAVELLGERDPSPTVTTSLRAFLPKGMPALSGKPPLVRRLATLRCLAASAVHAGKPGEAEVVRCAAHDPALPAPVRADLDALRDLSRLETLDRAEITGDKRDLVIKLAKDSVARVRERALGLLAKHPEAEDAPEVILKAFSSKFLGVVAAASEALAARPSIAFGGGPSKKAIEKALDPTSPPPEKQEKDQVVDPKVLEALDGAITRPMEEADAETKAALAGAIGALKYAKARGFVLRLCGDRSPALRKAGRDALARLDPPGKAPTCTTIDDHGAANAFASVPPTKKTVRLETTVGTLTLALDPLFAPVAAQRIAELAGSGFYDGTPIHRVVPGFVVQLGDPGGDGYGGAHVSLRCETAPVPFVEGDIGVALAGRDTGSSQFFVMLGRAPHLDGSYAWLGRASGPWSSIAEGDVVLKAKVE